MFGRARERRKLIVNVGKNKVMRRSRYVIVGQMLVRLNSEPFEEVDYFKYLGSQVEADGGCEKVIVQRKHEGYPAWGQLKRVLSNGGLGTNSKMCLYEGVNVTTALYGAVAWSIRSAERKKLKDDFFMRE